MASTSSSSVKKSFKYDVFLSFRGEDIRKTFIDHLYLALHSRGITTYKDDERIEKGKRIDDQLMRSIEESRFHIIVLSKTYASSSWCLQELVKIMDCHKTIEHTAYPVFYDVEPTEVRNQTGAVEEAFAKHVGKVGAGRWRYALKEAADLVGWELKNTVDGHEAKFIQKIVEYISLELRFIDSSVDGKLVGMAKRVDNVLSSLKVGCNDVRLLGIKGMGGGGKTTLARAVYDHISSEFDGKSFVEDVREVSKASGLKKLQKQVLQEVLKDKIIDVTGVADGISIIKKRMAKRKVLVVLDDVDDIGQLEALAGEPTWFEPGSRIIITTRDDQVLKAHRVDYTHDVDLLSHEEAICLFSRYAFGKDTPIQRYEELSRKVVRYAAGLPLTLKVLGSSLCAKTECQWDDAIERLKTIPEEQTLKRLELSYISLEDDQKEIFLDVSCLLKGKKKDKAIRILKNCGFHAELGLRVLEQKSLLTISNAGRLLLHDHIEELGMNIVRRSHPDDPCKHNRLWIKEEIEDILINDLGTEATRSVKLQDTDLHPAIIMKGLRKMKRLRFLYVDDKYNELIIDQTDKYLPNTLQYLHWPRYLFWWLSKTFLTNKLVDLAMGRSNISQLWKGGERKVVDQSDKYLPNTLQCLHWPRYPFWCLPKAFLANKLVGLTMGRSNISQLWEGEERKVLSKLKFLDLKYSKLRTFDLGMTPVLETFGLKECIDLVELKIPDECPHLRTLNLEGCSDFVELHMTGICPKLVFLNISGSKLSNINLGLTPNLESLYLNGNNEFSELHMPVELPKLKFLNLSCSKVSNLDLHLTPHLETLDLRGCNDFVELCMPAICLKLKSLYLSGSKLNSLNLGMTPHLETLDLGGCNDFVELSIPFECSMLKFLKLSGSKLSNLNLGLIPHLQMLDLRGCKGFSELCIPLELPNLKFLDLSGSKVSKLILGHTPNLEELYLIECNEFTELHTPVPCPKLRLLHLSGFKSSNIKNGLTPCFDKLECLKELSLSINEIKHVPDSICMLKHLRSLKLTSCCLLEHLPKNLGKLESLERLDLAGCISLRDIPNSICKMKCLKYLHLPQCILVKKLPEELGRLECLEELNIEGTGIRHLPQSIFELKGLRILWFKCRLESYGFTSLRNMSGDTAMCYI